MALQSAVLSASKCDENSAMRYKPRRCNTLLAQDLQDSELAGSWTLLQGKALQRGSNVHRVGRCIGQRSTLLCVKCVALDFSQDMCWPVDEAW
jgi:hypothetical protein